MLLDKIVMWILSKDSPISWFEYRLNRIMRNNVYEGIRDYNLVSGILAQELGEITDKLGLRKRY